MTHEQIKQITSITDALETVAKQEMERGVESAASQIPWEIQRQLWDQIGVRVREAIEEEIQRQLRDQIGVMVREAIKKEIGLQLNVVVTITPRER